MGNEQAAPDLSKARDSAALTSDKLLERLRKALARDGDFPASAKVVTELRRLTSDPKTTASQITEIILKEPSLGTRVLHLVNSSFYRRAKPIMTVSQAVIQIGMKPLAELCSGLVLLQKFVPAARQGGPFACCLQKTICTALLSGSLASDSSSAKGTGDELGYLAGSFAELGTLLLAFYFPQIYDTAVKRAKVKNTAIGQSIQEITGITPLRFSLEVVEALGLPEFYKDVLTTAAEQLGGKSVGAAKDQTAIAKTAAVLNAAEKISNVVVFNSSRQELDTVLQMVKSVPGLDPKKIDLALGDLPQQFRDHCGTLEVALNPLPEFVTTPAQTTPASPSTSSSTSEVPQDKVSQFVDEIRQAIEAREPTSSVITSVMETFAWGLKFDRVVLLLLNNDRQRMSGRMALGKTNTDPKSLNRVVGPESGPNEPCALALQESRPVFFGDGLFEDGWPLTVIPVGFAERGIGVIYADRVGADSGELNEREKAAIGVLAELLDRSLGMQS